jgi:hypothetical protein
MITGAEKGEMVTIFTLQGQIIYNEPLYTNTLNLNLNKGVYIVKVGMVKTKIKF